MKRVTFFLSLALGLSAQDPGGVPSPASGAVADAASSVASPGAGAAARPSRYYFDAHGRAWARLDQHQWIDEAGPLHRVASFPAGPVARLSRPSNAGWWKRHLADTAAHATGTALDAASSWGRMEANPILRSADGRFGTQGLSIKLGIFAGMEFVKWKLARRYPRSKLVRAISLAPAAAFGGVAARNWSVR